MGGGPYYPYLEEREGLGGELRLIIRLGDFLGNCLGEGLVKGVKGFIKVGLMAKLPKS